MFGTTALIMLKLI